MNNETYSHTATYSVEDNKLRIYPYCRLSKDEYNELKGAGFKWAPKQELFVAPAWSPEREDLCVKYCGEIEPEQTTMIERAEAKADRIEGAIEKKIVAANAFSQAAHDISMRFAGGQPILMGHHSQRKAEKDRERMDANMRKAVESTERAKRLNWTLHGVIAHANRKNDMGVRGRRIETLLKELRDLQRKYNDANDVLQWVERIEQSADFAGNVRRYINSGKCGVWGLYWDIENGKITEREALDRIRDSAVRVLESESLFRWFEHTLNRLSYERAMMGETPRFEGALTPAILQTFMRSQGADSPKAESTAGHWTVRSYVPLPLHISQAQELTGEADFWRDLMRDCGYIVPDKKQAKPPLLNLDVKALVGLRFGEAKRYEVVHITKAQYAKAYADNKWTLTSPCGSFRFRVYSESWRSPTVAVFITDSKAHAVPDSEAVER